MRLPLSDQAARLRAFAASPTATGSEAKLNDRLARANRYELTALHDGRGWSLAADVGVIAPVQPVDLSDPATLRSRAVQAQAAAEHFGVAVSPLLPGEVDTIKNQISLAPADAVTGVLQSLNQGLGPQAASALVGDMAKKDPETAMAIAIAPDRPLVARSIVLGGRLLHNKESKIILPQNADRAAAIADCSEPEILRRSRPIPRARWRRSCGRPMRSMPRAGPRPAT